MSDNTSGKSTEARIGRLETDMKHVLEYLTAFDKKLDNVASQGQITFPVIMTAVGTLCAVAVIAGALHWQSLIPFHNALIAHEKLFVRIDDRMQEDNRREMKDAYTFGRYDQTFATLDSKIEQAIVNRKQYQQLQDKRHEETTRSMLELNKTVTDNRATLKMLENMVLEHQKDDHPWSVLEKVGRIEERISGQEKLNGNGRHK